MTRGAKLIEILAFVVALIAAGLMIVLASQWLLRCYYSSRVGRFMARFELPEWLVVYIVHSATMGVFVVVVLGLLEAMIRISEID